MNRPFTTREKVMLLVLSLLLICMGYYRLILQPINLSVDELTTMTSDEESRIVQDMAKMQTMKVMEAELEEIFAQGAPDPIPTYDNFGVLITELHSILDGTVDYSLTFSGVGTMTGGYITYRPVQLTFTADSYAMVRDVFNRLYNSVNINQISDLSISSNRTSTAQREEMGEGPLTVNMRITYFELMP